jgi:ComF family protein
MGVGTGLGDALLAALLAPRCVVCEALLERPVQSAACAACWAAIAPLTPPLCRVCGDPLPSWRLLSGASGCCPRCRRTKRAIDRARAVGPYEGALRTLLHAFKYDGRRSLARPLAALMARAGAELLDGADCVVPVPLHWRRRRARGFNQALDLARHLGPPVVVALRRLRATRPQTGLPAAQRHRNVAGAFAPARRWWPFAPPRGSLVGGRSVVLVDDVWTTGATLEACARVLKHLGAREVRALTAARVVRGPRH